MQGVPKTHYVSGVQIVSDGYLTGGSFVVWEDARNDAGDIYVQRIDVNGRPVSGWPIDGLPVCTATGEHLLRTSLHVSG